MEKVIKVERLYIEMDDILEKAYFKFLGFLLLFGSLGIIAWQSLFGVLITPSTNYLNHQGKEKEQDVNEKICRTNKLIQEFFRLQIVSSLSPQRVQCLCPNSSLVSFNVTTVTFSKNCLDFKQNHCIDDSDNLLME